MSKKNKYYSDIKILKGKRSRFFKILGVLFFCGVIVLFSYSISLLLGKTLNVSGGLFKSNSSKYYAITFGEFSNESDAIACSQRVVELGAGGYIMEKNDKYVVIGAIYLNEKDAKNVIESNQNFSQSDAINILQLEIKKNKLSTNSEYSSVILNVVSKLYEHIIDFDKGNLNHISLASKVNVLDGECCVLLNKLEVDGFSSKVVRVEKVLNNLTNTVLNNQSVSSCAKYALVEIIDILMQ